MSAYVISVLAIMAINVMLAVSLNMISGFCGQFSLGHAAFYGAGAYGAAFFAAAGTPGSSLPGCSASLSALPPCACARISWR